MKLNFQKTNMASSPITWQVEGEKLEVGTDFIFLGSKIIADGECSHDIKGRLLLGRKAMANLDSILKSRDITVPTKSVWTKLWFDSWTIREAGWCWRRLFRVPWTARKSNQSVLKEINLEYALKGLMLMLKLQYFGHMLHRAKSLEKILTLGKIEGNRKRGWQRMR